MMEEEFYWWWSGEQFGNEEVYIFQNPAILMSFLSIKYRLSVIKYLQCVFIFFIFFKYKIDQV